jgi:integrase
MAKRENFTAERIEKLGCAEGRQQTIHWDGKTPGLGLRVTAAGAKSYVFETSLHGNTLRVTIGDVRTWTIGKAQAEARRLKAETDKGNDPRQQVAEQRATVEAARLEAERRELLVFDAWNAYIAARRNKWGARHLRNHEHLAQAGGKPRTRGRRSGESDVTIPGPLYPLLQMRLADLNGDAVRAWLEKEAAVRPTWASQAYRALQAFLAWASDQAAYAGIAHADACNRRMARDVLPKAKTKSDSLQREQLPAWFAAVRTIGNPVIAAYLQTLLLTGARREELAGLVWDDVDFRWQSLTIRDKVEGQRTIPLTPYVAALLVGLPRRNEWVFSSPSAESGRLQEPSIQHRKAIAIAGIEGLTLHGLRRSFSTLTEWLECPAGIVAQIMGHKPSATAEKHYKVRPLDLLRMWHTRIEAWILEQAGIPRPEEATEGLRLVAH